MDKKKAGIIIGVIVLAAVAAITLFWNQGSAERGQDKLDLAVKYVSEAKYEEAILAYNEAIKIDPKEPKAYQGLARVYTLQGKYDDAKGTYERGIDAVDSQNQTLLQIGLGGLYIDWGKIDEAEQAFQEIKEANPDCLEAYWGLATVYKQKEDNAKAEAMLREAVAANPDEYRAYNTLALFLKQNGQEQEALENLVKSLSLEINQQEAYLVLKDMYKERWSELTAQAGNVSDSRVSAMLMFYSYFEQEDYAAVVSSYNQEFSQQQDNDKAKILVAIAMVKTGDQAAAESIIKKVMSKDLNDWLFSDLASYYLAMGDQDKAKMAAIEALKANTGNLDAVSILQKVGSKDATGKLYAAEYLLYNWKPISEVKETLAAADIKLPFMMPAASVIDFIKNKYPDMQEWDLSGLKMNKADITDDGQDEIIMLGDAKFSSAFVLQPEGDSYRVLFKSDPSEHGSCSGRFEIDKFSDLILSFWSDGTGTSSSNELILRWDGSKLREIWSGQTKYEVYDMNGLELVNQQGTYSITGNKKPEKLKHVLSGIEEGRNSEVTTEYRFDEESFKFVEVSSNTEDKTAEAGTNLPNEIFEYKGIRLGMTEEQVVALVGDTLSKWESEYQPDIYVWEDMGGADNYKLLFDKSSQQVISMMVSETSTGIKSNDPVKKVTDLYGPGQIEQAYDFGGYYLNYEKDSSRQIQFFITNDCVNVITIGKRIVLSD